MPALRKPRALRALETVQAARPVPRGEHPATDNAATLTVDKAVRTLAVRRKRERTKRAT